MWISSAISTDIFLCKMCSFSIGNIEGSKSGCFKHTAVYTCLLFIWTSNILCFHLTSFAIPANQVDIQPTYFTHSLAKNEGCTCSVLKVVCIQTFKEIVSSWQNVSLMCLLGLFVVGLQSTWLSVSDTGTHTDSPSLMSKSTRRLPRCKCSPCTVITHFQKTATIGGFNQRQGEALPPQIFLTLKFVVWAKLQNNDVLRKIIEIVDTWC